ncbi:hypothetical protein AAES_57808 [Amazona aestiva]|uniref:Uncharacterized protein n=1 Tax=Amazona aestiva TaxID=12930 RepID=A0A0Q3MM55_AMAAE|nr:hypothetical protein AAES_57808 [Amazona aestiva]
MIHYAGVTAYNEVQSDTPVAGDNGESGGTGLTTFLERRVVAAIREVTRRDLHEGGPESRERTAAVPRCHSPRDLSDRPLSRETAPSHLHACVQKSVLPTGGPGYMPREAFSAI